jgi:Uma2 family endonuclease
MTILAPQPFRWTRERYDRMVEAGVLGPETHVQLIDGEVIQMTPQGSRHAAVLRLVRRALERVVPAGREVITQLPLALDDTSEPEPDVAIVQGDPRQNLAEHPHTALLVVEVSDSTLALDRTRKQRIYARNAIPEYWILNLAEAALEVHRNPQGDAYAARSILEPGDPVAPLACPGHSIPVADLLP